LNIESSNENRRWLKRSSRDGHPSQRAVPEVRRAVLPEDLLTASDIGLLFVDHSLLVQGFSTSILPFVSTEHCAVGRSAFHLSRDLGGTEFINGIRRVLDRQVSEDRTLQSRSGALLVRMSPAVMRVGPGVLVTVANVSTVTRNYDVVRRVLDSLPANIAFLDRLGNIRMTNGAWDRFGAENGRELGGSVIGANYLDECAGSIGDAALNGVRSVLDGTAANFDMEYPCETPTELRWFIMRCSSTGDGNVVVSHFDITAQKQAERALHGLATHDHLTSTMNRRGIEAQLRDEVNRVAHSGSPLAAIMLDCDNFKRANDRLGHAGGDAALSTIAQRIQSVLRASDSLARIGGDEFVVLLPGAPLSEAELVAERIRLVVAAIPIAMSHDDVTLTISAAVTKVDQSIHSLEQLLDRCRFALQSSKHEGRNRVTVADLSADDVSASESPLATLLSIITESSSIGVAAQAVVDLRTGRVTGHELLTRCLAPPFLGPSVLFQTANEQGLLGSLDERCLISCLEMGESLRGSGPVHVNCYPSTLLNMSAERLAAIFEPAGRDARSVVVELSEQQILGDPSSLIPMLQQLRSAGIKVALDDVGFGRTSLEALILLQPDIIKVDQAFVHGIAEDDARRGNIARLVRVVEALGAELIAEGVELQADADVLVELGVTYAQGFLFGRPELIAARASSTMGH
jgi:diguanylate cyclase (GGDEF)-like protein